MYAHLYMYMYINIYVCVCLCMLGGGGKYFLLEVRHLMSRWTTQTGYPVVMIPDHQMDSSAHFVVQTRYLNSGLPGIGSWLIDNFIALSLSLSLSPSLSLSLSPSLPSLSLSIYLSSIYPFIYLFFFPVI